MNCPKCNSIKIEKHESANYTLYSCTICDRIFGQKISDPSQCCDYKNVKIVKLEMSNGKYRKAECCINCLKTYINVKKETPHYMTVSYEERQKLKNSGTTEFSNLYNSILQKRRHYKQRYHEYLSSEEWKKKRLERLKIDKFTCQNCGNKSSRLDVHHITYETLYNESINDIITLCHPCHFKLHEND